MQTLCMLGLYMVGPYKTQSECYRIAQSLMMKSKSFMRKTCFLNCTGTGLTKHWPGPPQYFYFTGNKSINLETHGYSTKIVVLTFSFKYRHLSLLYHIATLVISSIFVQYCIKSAFLCLMILFQSDQDCGWLPARCNDIPCPSLILSRWLSWKGWWVVTAAIRTQSLLRISHAESHSASMHLLIYSYDFRSCVVPVLRCEMVRLWGLWWYQWWTYGVTSFVSWYMFCTL
jgi:hypothetical protein